VLRIIDVIKKSQKSGVNEIGVLLPYGQISSDDVFVLCDEDEREVDAELTTVDVYPDNSARWLNVAFDCASISIDKNIQTLFLKQRNVNTNPQINAWLTRNLNDITVPTCRGVWTFEPDAIRLANGNEEIQLRPRFMIAKERKHWHHVRSSFTECFSETGKPLCAKLEVAYNIDFNKPYPLNVTAHYKIDHSTGELNCNFTIHNPNAQIHHNGQWDLGNENSCFVDLFGYEVEFDSLRTCSLHVQKENGDDSDDVITDFISLEQFSSGGNNWQSKNHKNFDNTVPLNVKGARLKHGINAKEKLIDRPEPMLYLTTESSKYAIEIMDFWQKFPSCLAHSDHKINMSFTNRSEDTPVEIQPGESLCRQFVMHADAANARAKGIEIKPVVHSSVIPQTFFFSDNLKNDKLQALIDAGITGTSNFFEKRELLDEYGWRNYGDLYADHEAANSGASEQPFVSHYNNQYDPLLGFLKQWLITNNSHWLMLANALFDHLVNIDIYNTDADKPEYNHGLFWHTDHYVEAETATHRTYSQHQKTDVYSNQKSGGGPSADHCYTSGLVLYYFLFSDKRAFETVIAMSSWMSHIYEADGTLLGNLIRTRNSNAFKLPLSGRPLFGFGTGSSRNLLTNAYPIDRGTGNYINALLDCFELTKEHSFLSKAEFVILNTIQDTDDISSKNLDDIEGSWFYVIVLQAIAKYLLYTSQLTENTPFFNQIKRAFLHYARYMVDNEHVYLETPDKLEFPNDTWTAQDLRKIQVLGCAALLVSKEDSAFFLNKAKNFQDYVSDKLTSSKENQYTRILVLMMQNYGALSIYADDDYRQRIASHIAIKSKNKEAKFNNTSTSKRLIRFARQYSIKNEVTNLVKRVPKLRKVFSKARQ